MHILLITTYFEPDSGAAAVRLSRLAHILKARGHDITVLTTMPHYPQGQIAPDYRGRFSMTETRDGLRVVRCWLWATPSSRISRKLISQVSFMLTATLRGARLPRPDVMLIEAQPIFTGLAGMTLAGLLRVPYVLNVSDLWPDHLVSVGALTEDSLIYRLARHVVDFSYRQAAAIIALSPAWARTITAHTGRQDDIAVIYNGVDLARFHPDADGRAFRAAYGSEARYIVSFIGTFATQYDMDTMLAAAERLSQRDDVAVVFCGGGSQADRLASFVNAHDLPNVHYAGWLGYNAIPGAWAASDVTFFAMRSADLYTGTIPAKLYESLGSGTPIAAAISGEGAHMIHQSGGGLVVPPGNLDGLVSSIHFLLDDDAWRQRAAAAARTYAETHFDPQRVADRYEAVLSRFRRGHGG